MPAHYECEEDAAELDRKQKQRDNKRRSREKKKQLICTLRDRLELLKAKYTSLCAVADSKATNCQPEESDTLTIPVSSLTYSHLRKELDRLHQEQLWLKIRIQEYDVFAAMLERTIEIPRHRLHPLCKDQIVGRPVFGTFTPLTTETCLHIIRKCCQTIFYLQWRGERISSGARLFGWKEERYVDGTSMEFSLTKSLSFVSPLSLMEQTWNMMTSCKGLRSIQPAIIGVTMLQVVSPDIVVLEWQFEYGALLNLEVATIILLVFRIQTETGYFVASKILKRLTDTEQQQIAQEEIEADNGKRLSGLQWYLFEKQPLGNDDGYDDLLLDEMDSVDAIAPMKNLTECKVTRGGYMDEENWAFLRYFLIEVLLIMVRWDQAVASPKLPFFKTKSTKVVETGDDNCTDVLSNLLDEVIPNQEKEDWFAYDF